MPLNALTVPVSGSDSSCPCRKTGQSDGITDNLKQSAVFTNILYVRYETRYDDPTMRKGKKEDNHVR